MAIDVAEVTLPECGKMKAISNAKFILSNKSLINKYFALLGDYGTRSGLNVFTDFSIAFQGTLRNQVLFKDCYGPW